MHSQELLASIMSMRNTEDREHLQTTKMSLRIVDKAILRDFVCLFGINKFIFFFMFVPCISNIKIPLLKPTNAHHLLRQL